VAVPLAATSGVAGEWSRRSQSIDDARQALALYREIGSERVIR